MKSTAALNVFSSLVLPGSVITWVLLLMFWCLFSSTWFILTKSTIGYFFGIRHDFIVISVAAAPCIAAAMALSQHRYNTQTELAKIATTDTLTGLMNRRAFFEAVQKSDEGAMLLIDIDHFKAVNDRYGHTAGDAVLVAMADHLRRNIRSNDLLCRVGGEEFGAYLFGADSLEVDTIGARICRGFILYNEVVPSPIKVTMSIGTAYSAMSPSIAELYRRADEALYQAKRSGRAKLNFWQPVQVTRI